MIAPPDLPLCSGERVTVCSVPESRWWYVGILDDARAATGGSGPHRLMPQLLARMSDEERAETEEALADLTVSNRGLAKALTNRGYPISESAIHKYRADNGYR